jgi:diacylglycerol kinase (ATP)
MRLLLVVNPISGGKSKDGFLASSERFFKKYGIESTTFRTTGSNDIDKLKQLVRDFHPDRVMSVGGDGTTLLTALALQKSKVPFGIIPMGSANGMARELDVPTDPMHALNDLLLSQIIVPLDLIRVNSSYHSIHLGDIGINAAMVDNFSKERSRGWLAYAKHFVDAVKSSTPFRVDIKIDGRIYEHEAYSVLIANTRMYGTGAIVNPSGNPHDGLFEIVVIKQNDLSGLINLGLTAITDKLFAFFLFFLLCFLLYLNFQGLRFSIMISLITSPSFNSPFNISSATRSSRYFWIALLSGLAPY